MIVVGASLFYPISVRIHLMVVANLYKLLIWSYSLWQMSLVLSWCPCMFCRCEAEHAKQKYWRGQSLYTMQGQYTRLLFMTCFLVSCIVWLCQVPTHMSLLRTDVKFTPQVVIFVSTLVTCFTGTCTMSPCIICLCRSSPMYLSKISTLLL
jgi:hypothetical protein